MTNKLNVLFIDIETSPIIAYTWGPKWETNIIENINESQILCFSARWLGGKQVTKGLIDYKGYKKGIIDDELLVNEIHGLFDIADVVVGQNNIAFDNKVINARFIKHGLPPPSPFKMVDTKMEAKRYLKLSSYGLDDMCKYFDIGKKLSHEGFDLWKNCIAGDEKSWSLMKRYNANDVLLTEKLYEKLRPFMKSHPNVSIVTKKNSCPKCGSDNVHARGYAANSTSLFQRAQCNSCGGWFRFGKAVLKLNNTRTNI